VSEDQSKVTGRDRVVAAYKGGFADRVPAYPIAGSFAGCLDGLSIEEYCTNPTRAARAMLNYYERYQPDIMIAFNDLAKEAEAVGCHVKYSDYVVPSIDRHVLQDDKGRLAKLEVPDPLRDARLPAFLEQCAALSAARLPSGLGAVLTGPWTIAMLMRNPELMCLDTIDDPEFVHDLMRFSTEYAKRFGDAVIGTKIGLSYTDPTASCSLVGPDTYREFIKPYHKELVDYFRAKKVGTTVHICGTTHQIHEDLVDVGFVAITIDLDQQGDPALKVDQLDKLVTLGNQRGVVAIGNVDVTIFERATQAEIEAEVRRCIDTVGKRSRFVLSTSCELPPRANPDCVTWMMNAAREYGRYDRILSARTGAAVAVGGGVRRRPRGTPLQALVGAPSAHASRRRSSGGSLRPSRTPTPRSPRAARRVTDPNA
jgi:uroporphyrinogen decarboxylase